MNAALLNSIERRGHLVLDEPVELRSGGDHLAHAVALVAGDVECAAGVPYRTLRTYTDLGIPPVGSE